MNHLITTSDGSHTIFVPELNEHYHSVHGAVQEADLVYIKNGFGFCNADPLNIFEVGFGTGLNVLMTVISILNDNRIVYYTSIDKHPLHESVIQKLNHHTFAGSEGKTLFDKIHGSKWGYSEKITDHFYLKKIECDLVTDKIEGEYN